MYAKTINFQKPMTNSRIYRPVYPFFFAFDMENRERNIKKSKNKFVISVPNLGEEEFTVYWDSSYYFEKTFRDYEFTDSVDRPNSTEYERRVYGHFLRELIDIDDMKEWEVEDRQWFCDLIEILNRTMFFTCHLE